MIFRIVASADHGFDLTRSRVDRNQCGLQIGLAFELLGYGILSNLLGIHIQCGVDTNTAFIELLFRDAELFRGKVTDIIAEIRCSRRLLFR
ncbi:hypothetical protein D3C85_1567680 [compost metagenome]